MASLRWTLPGLLLVATGACERAPAPVLVREIAAVPDAAVYASWIDGASGSWHWWLANVDDGQAIEVAVLDAGRFDQMSLTQDGRYAVAMTSESSRPRVYENQRVWTLDLPARRVYVSQPTVFVYQLGGDATSPWLVGSTFREEYGLVRSLLSRLRSNDPGCRRAAAQFYRWRRERWALERELVAPDCASPTGPVVTLATELEGTYERMLTAGEIYETNEGPWRLSLDSAGSLVVAEGEREVLRRESVFAATLWRKPYVVELVEPE